jgi:hypothetical protein
MDPAAAITDTIPGYRSGPEAAKSQPEFGAAALRRFGGPHSAPQIPHIRRNQADWIRRRRAANDMNGPTRSKQRQLWTNHVIKNVSETK